MKVGIVAGEKSGDYLGSELIKAIKLKHPNAQFVGLCGPLMQAEGAQTLAEMDKISIMGLAGVVSGLKDILSIRKRLYKHFVADPPDVFIGIDVPDFNLGLERKLKEQGIPTVHYVSPTVWAWRPKRIVKIKKSIDLMLTLFPFEEKFYQHPHTPVKYVGHPLASQVLDWQPDDALRASLADQDQTLIAVLPGSRMSEVTRLAPEMLKAAYDLHAQRPELRFAIPVANDKIKDFLIDELKVDQAIVTLVDGRSRDLLCIADLVVLASGTAALEAALFAKPMVVMYKMDWLTILLFKHTVQVAHFSMPNQLTDPPIVPELIQEAATAENLQAELVKLLDDPAHFREVTKTLSAIAPDLSMDSGNLAYQAINEMLESKKRAPR
jgi:lipid-A-disaccharide synthase